MSGLQLKRTWMGTMALVAVFGFAACGDDEDGTENPTAGSAGKGGDGSDHGGDGGTPAARAVLRSVTESPIITAGPAVTVPANTSLSTSWKMRRWV